ncbi:MAG: hypothetical protein GF416_03885 [Candidatus Altiarchaeales archaeon]|nr:hypothetical protein [Candidatus Altiarchaeales archaeon]MBD3416260.1 hypothetical protein [Candidatus Altiarchaeales archaeon]
MRYMKYALVFLLVLASAGCIRQGGGGSPTTTLGEPAPTTPTVEMVSDTTATTSTTLEEVEEPDPTTTTLRVDASNLSACMGVSDLPSRDECLYQLAARTKNTEVCGRIDDSNKGLKCRAMLENDPGLCKRVDVLEDRDWCYRMMAFKWNDIGYCDMIRTQQIKDKCAFDYVKDKKPDPYRCFQMIDARLRDECILLHVGLDRINPRLCHLITDPELELECNQTYIHG